MVLEKQVQVKKIKRKCPVEKIIFKEYGYKREYGWSQFEQSFAKQEELALFFD